MEQKHTMEPWRVGDAGVTVFGPPNGTPSPETVAGFRKKASAARAVACVNALAGLDPAGLAEAVVALEAVRDTGGPTENMRHADALDLIDDLRRIARLALAALRGKGG